MWRTFYFRNLKLSFAYLLRGGGYTGESTESYSLQVPALSPNQTFHPSNKKDI